MTNDEVTAKFAELTERIERLEAGKRGAWEKPMVAGDKHWPAWRYPPGGGEGKIFENEKKVPKGWLDAPAVAEQAA